MKTLRYSNPEDRLDYADYVHVAHIDGWVSEPANLFTRWLEKRRVIPRRYVLSNRFPTMTRMVWNEWPTLAKRGEMEDQMYFYGDPEVYVKTGYMNSGPEIVRGVAILDKNTGLIWYSRPKARHANLMWIMSEYGVSAHDKAEAIQGFITTRGYFLTREEALIRAQEQGQLIKKTHPLDQLFSEDLFEGRV